MNTLFEKTTRYLDKQIAELPEGHPIERQYKIDSREYEIKDCEIVDPIGDEIYTKAKGLIHRYSDRVLLFPRNDCLIQCRFCFRKWRLQTEKTELTYDEISEAMKYISAHDEIWEVILTGGEPLMTDIRKLEYIINELKKISHIKVLRIHTRAIIAEPSIITNKLTDTLCKFEPLYIVIHCNHPDEITTEVSEKLKMLSQRGIVLLSQSALLKGVNADTNTIEKLCRKLIENRVKPYYLHHCDLVPGTGHFRTSINEGQNILKGIRGRVSGICWPTYVLDIPNGFGKVPLGPFYYEKNATGNTIVTDYKGNRHEYPDIDNKTKV